ncbi:DNA methyltransferase [Desulfobacula sp.]
MKDKVIKIPVSDIVLDESIYPRENIDHKRVHVFEENLRDGFSFDPIQVQACSDPDPAIQKIWYRVLDGAHRWTAFKNTGRVVIPAIVKTLDGADPLLYAAKQAIGPKQLTEVETKNTARRAFQSNPRLTSAEIGRAIGRSRQAVDLYIADLRATTLLELDLKIFRLNQLGIPQDRIAKRLDIPQQTISRYLPKMPALAKWVNSDLSKGFTVPQVAQKHDWTEPMVWSQALQGKDDQTRFKALNWGIRTWDLWNFNDCDKRFGDVWPGRIPAQLVAHILYFFSKQDDLVFDPMAGGGVCADTCLAMGRRCWSLDMEDRPETRPEIEPYHWNLDSKWKDLPIMGSKGKPDLIICDPPYFDKKASEYSEQSISGLSRKEYLKFLEKFFLFLKIISKKNTRLAFINSDWRDFQNCPANKEEPGQGILVVDYYEIFKKTGWTLTHIIQAPLSSERFNAGVVAAMQKKKILGVVSRYVMILR